MSPRPVADIAIRPHRALVHTDIPIHSLEGYHLSPLHLESLCDVSPLSYCAGNPENTANILNSNIPLLPRTQHTSVRTDVIYLRQYVMWLLSQR